MKRFHVILALAFGVGVQLSLFSPAEGKVQNSRDKKFRKYSHCMLSIRASLLKLISHFSVHVQCCEVSSNTIFFFP